VGNVSIAISPSNGYHGVNNEKTFFDFKNKTRKRCFA